MRIDGNLSSTGLVKPATARLFFALWPETSVRQSLIRAGRLLHENCGGRLTRPETIHLTLLFLGDVAVSRIDELKDLPNDVAGQAFELSIDKLGWWKHNRVAWAAPDTIPEALPKLVRSLEERCRDSGFRFDARPYLPHITLARKALCQVVPRLEVPILWKAEEFVLVRSLSDASGAAYQVIGRWPLA